MLNLKNGKAITKESIKFFPNKEGVYIRNNYKFTILGIPENTNIKKHINEPPAFLSSNVLYSLENVTNSEQKTQVSE